PITTEDYGAVLFRFKGGARGGLHVSQVTAGRKNCLRWEIAGSQCAMAWGSESPNELWIGHRDKPNECLLRDPALVADTPRAFINYPGGHNEGFPDAFKQCFRAFYQAVASGDDGSTAIYPTFEEGHREIILCEAILESHRRQQWVTL
ncbi:MAG: Gfo/Idh/MocA family oxidoreductase, partial [Thermoguttaceae bacterium]